MKGKENLSRELTVLVLILLVLANAAIAVTMFGIGLWIVGLLNTAASLYALYTMFRMM